MAVVRRSNCVQVIDPASSPSLALLPVSQALHLSFTSVPQMGENISKERPVPSIGSPLVKDFQTFTLVAAFHLMSAEAIILCIFTCYALADSVIKSDLQ